MTSRTRTTRAFTLIELLVVIAIIAILSSVVLASLSAARVRGDDAKRRADLTQVRIALELYYDAYGQFPSTNGCWTGAGSGGCVSADWIPGLVASGMLAALPQDPKYPNHGGGACSAWAWPSMYIYKSIDGTGYALLAHCPTPSNVGNTTTSDSMYDPMRPNWAWKVCSGAECEL